MATPTIALNAARELVPAGRLVDVIPLPGGVSADVWRLTIAEDSGEPRHVVLRSHRAGFKAHDVSVVAKEFAVLLALHRRGLPVPEPYLLRVPESGPPALLMEYVEGSASLEPACLELALDQMARLLARLHGLLDLEIPELGAIEDPRQELPRCLPRTDAGDAVRSALATGNVASPSNPPVLLHGDYWPGNLLWRGGRLAALIDWEDTCFGDPLADLATARVELLCAFGPEAAVDFTDRYLAEMEATGRPVSCAALPLWESYVSAAALSSMHSWGLDPAEEARRRRLTREAFDAAARLLSGCGRPRRAER